MKTGVSVMDAMTKGLISVTPVTTVKDCAKKMLKEGVGGILVMENAALIGMVTEKDLVEKIVARGADPGKIKVAQIMSRRIVSIAPHEDIYEALITMRDEEVRRLPVVHEKKPVGILTEKDILKIEPSLFDIIAERMKLREEREKPLSLKGKCESCGMEKRLKERGGRLLCELCRRL